MLVLTRKLGEALVVGNNEQQITIRIHEIRGGKIRLAFEGPRTMMVMREETYQAMKFDSRKEAAKCETSTI